LEVGEHGAWAEGGGDGGAGAVGGEGEEVEFVGEGDTCVMVHGFGGASEGVALASVGEVGVGVGGGFEHGVETEEESLEGGFACLGVGVEEVGEGGERQIPAKAGAIWGFVPAGEEVGEDVLAEEAGVVFVEDDEGGVEAERGGGRGTGGEGEKVTR